ncbi:small ribosomal subunit protein mS37 [Petromyzon marinus]|nr:coiled-coil-helix-coiled-coil-helix domain-containing protein 1 [Petromyzon marinus]
MASRCADINVRAALLTTRLSKKPPLEPKRALALQDKAGFKREPLGEATCITEMMLLMGCWRLNNFTDSPCSSEIRAFSNCSSKTKAQLKDEQDGGKRTPSMMSQKQANALLSRFPIKANVRRGRFWDLASSQKS